MNATAARARQLLVLACAASAGVHFALAPEHWRESAISGVAFAASAVALAACAVALDRLPRSRLAVTAAAVLLAGLLGAYLLTRFTAMPPLADHAEPVDAVGVATKVVEAAGLALAVVVSQRTVGRPDRQPALQKGVRT
jgi:Kef-type K+ transport system membrane component KefB